MKKKVCVIIPAYNESTVIEGVIKQAHTAFKKSPYKIDIVVVNDGSKDATSDKARRGGAIVIDHILNSGAGGATSTGIEFASLHGYDAAATMDADGQHNPGDVVNGLNELFGGNADLLIGSRIINSENMPIVKKIGNWGLSAITRLLFGVKSTDSQSGLRIYSANALQNLRWKTSGYEFCSEMLWRAHQQKLLVDEYPISVIYTDYSKSKGQSNWNAVNIVRTLVQQRVQEIFE